MQLLALNGEMNVSVFTVYFSELLENKTMYTCLMMSMILTSEAVADNFACEFKQSWYEIGHRLKPNSSELSNNIFYNYFLH